MSQLPVFLQSLTFHHVPTIQVFRWVCTARQRLIDCVAALWLARSLTGFPSCPLLRVIFRGPYAVKRLSRWSSSGCFLLLLKFVGCSFNKSFRIVSPYLVGLTLFRSPCSKPVPFWKWDANS
ncbi:unnamed protein product [Victoria cruziana]